jgi:SAM-dependent methyltransferase
VHTSAKIDLMRRHCKSTAQFSIRRMAGILGKALPLSTRQALVARMKWRRVPGWFEFCIGMLDDLRRHDPDALHRFLWANHLAYAMSYEVATRFDASNLNPSRRILFEDINGHLRSWGMDPRKDIRSVFEVGCSMGYLLRHLEVEVFPSASILHGIDIDRYAVETGNAHLRSLQSGVKLSIADMAATEDMMGNRIYDVVICCGVLMYANENTAAQVVRSMLRHAGHLVGLICLAGNGAPLQQSETRASDGAFVHDVAGMIHRAGGRVLSSKWIGSSTSGSSPAYAILASASDAARGIS